MQDQFRYQGNGKEQEINQHAQNKSHHHFCGCQIGFTDRDE
jgi:hypothetical protein